MTAVNFSFRAMTESDLPDVVRWCAAPHAAPWHSADFDLAAASDKYLPWIRGEHPNHLTVILADGRACGYAWHYRVGDHREYSLATAEPDAIGIDVVIGDPRVLDQARSATVVGEYLRQVVLTAHPDAIRVISSPAADNLAAVGMLTAAGFTRLRDVTVFPGEPAETLCAFDPAHRSR